MVIQDPYVNTDLLSEEILKTNEENRDKALQMNLNLMTQKISRMKESNAKSYLDDLIKRQKSDFSFRAAQGGLDFDYPSEIDKFESDLRNRASDALSLLSEEDRNAFNVNAVTEINNLKMNSFKEIEKQERQLNKDFLDEATSQFYKAQNSRDPEEVTSSFESLKSKLDASRANGFIDKEDYDKRLEVMESLKDEARVEILEDSINKFLFQEGDFDEANDVIDEFMNSDDFDKMNLKERETVFKLKKKVLSGKNQSQSLSGIRNLKKDAEESAETAEEDYLTGDIGYKVMEQQRLKAAEYRNMEIINTKDPIKREALKRENLKSLVRSNLLRMMDSSPKNFIGMTPLQVANKLSSEDLKLVDKRGNFTELGDLFNEQYQDLRNKYGGFKANKIEDLNRFIKDMRNRAINGDPESIKLQDKNVGVIDADSVNSVRLFGSSIAYKDFYQTASGKKTAEVLYYFHSRKYLAGSDGITHQEAGDLYDVFKNFLMDAETGAAGKYLNFLKAEGIDISDVLDSQDVKGSNIESAIKIAGNTGNKALNKYVFQGLQGFSGNDVVKNNHNAVFSALAPKLREYVDNNKRRFEYYGDKDGLVTLLTLGAMGALKESNQFTSVGRLNAKNLKAKDLVNDYSAIGNFVESISNSKQKVADNIFIDSSLRENAGVAMFVNSFRAGNEYQMRTLFKGADGSNYDLSLRSSGITKGVFTLFNQFGKFPLRNEKDFRENTRMVAHRDKIYLYEKNPDTGSWDRLRDSGGNDVKIAVEDLNKFHEELSSTGAYSKDYNEISETLKKKRFEGAGGTLRFPFRAGKAIAQKFGVAINMDLSIDKDSANILPKLSNDELESYKNSFNSPQADLIMDDYDKGGVAEFMRAWTGTKYDVVSGQEVTTLKSNLYYREQLRRLEKDKKEGKDVKHKTRFLTPEEKFKLDSVRKGQIIRDKWAKKERLEVESLPKGTAKIDYVYDGDTANIKVKHPIKGAVSISVRLVGINAPEKGRKNRASEKGAEEALEYFRTLASTGKITYSSSGKGRYGRQLVDLYVDGRSINSILLEKGFAVKFEGKGIPTYEKAPNIKGLGATGDKK